MEPLPRAELTLARRELSSMREHQALRRGPRRLGPRGADQGSTAEARTVLRARGCSRTRRGRGQQGSPGVVIHKAKAGSQGGRQSRCNRLGHGRRIARGEAGRKGPVRKSLA